MARIALDAMGGDFAPQATVAGALLALEDIAAEHVIQLVGQTAVIEQQLNEQLNGDLAHLSAHRSRIQIVEAPDTIEMSEKPTSALRKPESSMMVGLKLQVEGKSDAFVSAGNTGAQMAASTVVLKLHPGLSRPAIATVFPTTLHPMVVLDSGANVDCSARELLQFAWLGHAYAETLLGRSNPSIGLLSIGEEPEKGNAVVKEAHASFKNAGFNFHGNIEGRDIPAGKSDNGPIDVAVCDGFVGNVVLKLFEAAGQFIITKLVTSGIKLDEKEVFTALKSVDSSSHGGAPLLGVRGISIISHGKSNPRAIKNAIKVALRAIESKMDEKIGRRLTDLAAANENGATAQSLAQTQATVSA